MTNRTMTLKYNGVSSEVKCMPGSYSQGCFLAMILFIIQFNGALLRPPVPRCICDLSKHDCEQSRIWFLKNKNKGKPSSAEDVSVKFIDDCSAAASYNLTKVVEPVTTMYQQPATYNQRTGHKVKPEKHKLQFLISEFEVFANRNDFVINKKKCEVMIFNFSNNYAFPPDINLGNSEVIQEVTHTKLLGLIVQSDLKWSKNTEHIFKKAASKIWLLRRLQKFNLGSEILLDFFKKEIRCH